ncbi:sn-glycerol-3-phosphate ABC transporter ATP-binding protein UgpC [Lutibacter sp.]|uniref:ABC transporter ATP-binding protein n=1 Tax=Lutibacter sp. TaxID=1925666 RepID=UPI0025C375B9|nr:sn-glycerol-3-phosphate ABC transporter ATP-binding protein UgpC [Lutibacter sp.]MCF6181920.1 sn-glycerol-3-phosphate ABC transporter ATP-binding protein UgpC [Lutibacter sp.]
MAEVKLINIEKEYEVGVKAVTNLNLSIKDKEFVVLVGPSGCGKSTTLRMIAGLEEISSGELYIDEKEVSQLHPKLREIAMVFQNYALYPHMTVYDNMAFGLKIKHVKKEEIKERVMAAAKILELEKLLTKRPGEMSGGQRQRVAIGRAIVRKPKVFLFDEPLSNLDAKLRGQMRTEIAKLHKSLKTTIIYVTHDQVEAMTLGDRIAVLNKGKLEQYDTPMNLYNHPTNKFVAGFIGTPPMNFVEGKIAKEDDNLFFVEDHKKLNFEINTSSVLLKYENKKVILGFRAEAVGIQKFSKVSSFKGKIESLEILGAEQYLTVSGLDNLIISKVSADKMYQLNDTITLNINLDKIYFFDKKTEKCIH